MAIVQQIQQLGIQQQYHQALFRVSCWCTTGYEPAIAAAGRDHFRFSVGYQSLAMTL